MEFSKRVRFKLTAPAVTISFVSADSWSWWQISPGPVGLATKQVRKVDSGPSLTMPRIVPTQLANMVLGASITSSDAR
jgi:hypothetical protein